MNDASASRAKVILTTPRLVLRTTTDADIAVMQARIFGDPEVMRYVFGGQPMSPEAAAGFMRKFFTFGAVTGIAILTEKPNLDVIGFAGLFPCAPFGVEDLEIGFVLARTAWGRGIACEIGEAQLAFGFNELRRERLLGMVHPDNAASIHALTKLGMHYVRDVQEPNRPMRSVYMINAAAWRARCAG